MILATLGALMVVLAIAGGIVLVREQRHFAATHPAKVADARTALATATADLRAYDLFTSERGSAREALDPDGRFSRNPSRHRWVDIVEYRRRELLELEKMESVSNRPLLMGCAVVAVLGALLVMFQCFYRQDIGEAKVQVSWSGELVGQTIDPGFHLKAPWVSVRTFDVRNNLVTYVGQTDKNGKLANYAGNVTTGPQITFQDKEGVTGNLDVTLRYSLEPGSVLEVYSDFQTQDNFVNKVISEGVRAEARVAPSTKGTLEVYSDKAGLASAIRAGLEERWKGLGIIIEDVAVQETRYSPEVQQRFDEAQAARIAVTKAEAEQEAARVTADTQVITAQGVADAAVVAAEGQAKANALLTKSLTPEVLQQRYIDALKAGTVFVVPEGSSPLITTGK